jgi:FdhD protein
VEDLVAVEEPLEIRVNHRPVSVTMRTPGDDRELAAGFLLTEGILRSAGDIVQIEELENIVNIEARNERTPSPRNFYLTSSCGICGKASIDAIRTAGANGFNDGAPCIDRELLAALPRCLRDAQETFESTGGLHAAGIFDNTGELLFLKEDVGRHNAVDKVIGERWLASSNRGDLLLVSGRAGFELVQKAAMARIPILAAIGAPSTLAIELAEELRMTLIGFLRDGRFNIYADARRVSL